MTPLIKKPANLLAGALLAFGACSNVSIDADQTVGTLPAIDGPTVEFDPANAIIPFPNNLLLSPTTGKVNIPAQCGENATTKAVREGVLNTLDGFGTFEAAMQVTFTAPVDPTTLTGHVLLYKRATGAAQVDPTTATAIPVTTIVGTTVRFDSTCTTPSNIDSLTIIPDVPLDEKSTYVVALTAGIKTATGDAYIPSATWAFVRQSVDPVTVVNGVVVADRTPLDPTDPTQNAELLGIDLLWNAHAQALAFLDAAAQTKRGDILVAFEFNTQTTTDPLNPAVPGSLAATVPTDPLVGTQSITQGASGEEFMQNVLGVNACAALGCNAIGDVLGGALIAPNYQTDGANPLSGGDPIPGPWSDPVHPTQNGNNVIKFLAFTPNRKIPTGGFPTIVFGHGLGGSKTNLFAIASQFAAAGFASVAIDFVASGDRAVQNSNDAALGCDGVVKVDSAPQCFAPILSADLAGTRDNLRQTSLDMLSLVAALKACGRDGDGNGICSDELVVDPAQLNYAGISLGGIEGSVVAAVSPDFKSALLNVPGVGLLDILENTDSLEIRCSLVDSLIGAGVLTGALFNPTDGTGLCTTDAWKASAQYQTFSSTARWVIDPADGANYTNLLATRKVLMQEVVGDQVVPNLATDDLGALIGLTPQTADIETGADQNASAAITTAPTTNKWLRYPTLPADSGSGFPGNAFQHASLLAPVSDANGPTIAGELGTERIQIDGITWLAINGQTR